MIFDDFESQMDIGKFIAYAKKSLEDEKLYYKEISDAREKINQFREQLAQYAEISFGKRTVKYLLNFPVNFIKVFFLAS